jgi:hypothetical protein
MRTIPFLLIACCALVSPAQNATPSADAPPPGTPAGSAEGGAAKARAALDAMVQALGGDRWLNLESSYTQGRIAAFYQGKPTGANVQFWDWKTPTEERLDLDETKHDKGNWVQLFSGKQCVEVTYRGIRPMQAVTPDSDPCADAIRRRDHSIEAAVKVWMKDSNTILLYEGQSLAERHLATQVTLIDSNNDSITILMDADSHLPLQRSYTWRDPIYKDKNEEVEEYDDYHNIGGVPTPFAITRIHNGDMTQQRFVFKASNNGPPPPEGFDAQAILNRIRH